MAPRAVRVTGYLALAGLVAALAHHVDAFPGAYDLAVRVASAASALVYLAALGAAAGAIGRRLARACALVPEDRGLAAALALTFGLGALGFAALALGYAGVLARPAVLTLLALCCLSGKDELGPLLSDLRWAVARDGASGFYPVIAGALALALVMALAPPVFGDEGLYQAFLPARYAAAGAIPLTGESKYAYTPPLCHALAALGVAYGVPEAPRLDQWLAGLVLLLGLAGWARQRGAPPGLAVVLYLGTPIAFLSLSLANVTTTKTLFQTMVLVALCELADAPAVRRAVGVGLLLGAFLWVKQVALATVAFLALALLAGRPAPRALLGLALVVAGVVGGPYFLKNAVLTGDPLYPYLWPHLEGRGWNAILAYNELVSCRRVVDDRPVSGSAALSEILAGPDRSNYEGAGLGVLLFGASSALLLAAGPLAARLAAFLLVYLALWTYGTGPLVSRSLVPLVPALCLLVATGLGRAKRAGGRAFAALVNAVVLAVAACTAPAAQILAGLPYELGLEDELACRVRSTGDVARALALVDHVLPPGTRVLALNSGSWPLFTHCTLVLSKDVGGAFALDTPASHRFLEEVTHVALPPPSLKTREDALSAMRAHDLHHLLVAKGLEAELEGYSILGLLKPDLKPVFDAHGFRLYRIE